MFHPAFGDRACVIDSKGLTAAMPRRPLPDAEVAADATAAAAAFTSTPASQGSRRRLRVRAASVAAIKVAATAVPKKPEAVHSAGAADGGAGEHDPFPFIVYHPRLQRQRFSNGAPVVSIELAAVPRQLLTSPAGCADPPSHYPNRRRNEPRGKVSPVVVVPRRAPHCEATDGRRGGRTVAEDKDKDTIDELSSSERAGLESVASASSTWSVKQLTSYYLALKAHGKDCAKIADRVDGKSRGDIQRYNHNWMARKRMPMEQWLREFQPASAPAVHANDANPGTRDPNADDGEPMEEIEAVDTASKQPEGIEASPAMASWASFKQSTPTQETEGNAACTPATEVSRPLTPLPHVDTRAAVNMPSTASPTSRRIDHPSIRTIRAELTPQDGGVRGFPAFPWRMHGAAGRPVMPVFPKRRTAPSGSKTGHKKRWRTSSSTPSTASVGAARKRVCEH